MRKYSGCGGALPGGWEYFKSVKGLFIITRTDKSGVTKIMGLCPCKCPLDPVFANQVRNKNRDNYDDEDYYLTDNGVEYNSSGLQVDPYDPLFSAYNGTTIGEKEIERTILERDRRSVIINKLWEADSVESTFSSLMETKFHPYVVDVANLCATKRYYSQEDLPHTWFNVPGGLDESPPPESYVQTFINWWLKRFETCAVKLKSGACGPSNIDLPILVVHCTHGVNRTGYLVVRLLMGLQPEASVPSLLEKFGIARGHFINKANWIEQLKITRREKIANDKFYVMTKQLYE